MTTSLAVTVVPDVVPKTPTNSPCVALAGEGAETPYSAQVVEDVTSTVSVVPFQVKTVKPADGGVPWTTRAVAKP
jgi:hypothetical protein